MQATKVDHLKAHDAQLVRLRLLAKRSFAQDPNTSLPKLWQPTELLAQLVATNAGLCTMRDEKQVDLQRCLQHQGIIGRDS